MYMYFTIIMFYMIKPSVTFHDKSRKGTTRITNYRGRQWES